MLKQPVTQKRLTNVAIVRLKSHGKRFEVAAYKNKVLNWRDGIEKDINEVLQVITVFTNVSKGDVAKEQDMKKAFGTCDQEEVCRKILKSGDLQVSDKEREVHMEGLFRDIVQIVVERCVYPQTGRQLTALTVESALRTIGFSVKPEHAAKKQALKAIEALCTELPESFARAKMRLRISCPEKLREEIRKYLLEEASAQIEEESAPAGTGPCSFTFVCGPSHYRELDRLTTVTHAGEDVALHVVTATVTGQGGDANLVCTGIAALVENATTASMAEVSSAAGQEERRPRLQAQPHAPPQMQPQLQPQQQQQPAKKGLKCSACAVEFEDAGAYRQHCRSEWHNFNLKRKVKNLPSVSEEEYAEISLDVREGFLAVES
mmetsp:Transcript_66087/g.166640  ORF Transcript_66087/g.166640 Transcript_66087/m.166640 type:complete len:376 (+) Transcript_66087:119-1246(+)